ncbi:flagellar basal-body MS-ring/collar protein FliF [Sporosarcina pasteurii]|uniref:Flagellar M-ring protein n=1 Tax=Sporosarcina pasteurii TaxID=1474 RepID=A0A380BHM8_SPOPA|nr:flagellar basal-body MS-ring/collar protein FliF [Sporosarcina pasteurii]MDS9470578.1 flagellar basal-body MS-ring/collar protein FliF [Sporosarcina pasteurii]QBQ05733.1 flagellar basal body M-ring protein FliF [Sporosarcina pasteurii]SUJ00807.1 Flagellar M-ring protein [Sporosarcina pasteurii]
MNERLAKTKNELQTFWSSRTKKQKTTYGASLLAIIIIAATITFFLSRTEYVPLYTDVSTAEIGRIKEQLDMLGVQSQIAPGGTSILVPKERVDDLLVTLAAEGYPNSGTIDYSFFSNNAGFGMTDNEFNVIKLASMQTELANLMKGIEGVKDAKVMLTLPSENIFLNDNSQRASAAIVLNTNPGHQFSDSQINALYNLVSKSIPNLSKEDIEITNQYFEYFDLKTEKEQFGTSLADQIAVKKSIERDLQRQVQMMLGTMMGQDKVIVSVTTDIDFKLENREESLVTPVDVESMEGIALSVQRITESFTGNAPVAGGEPPMDNSTDNYTEFVNGSNGDYERIEETVNHEVNRIRKEIVESPYKIRDIGIQVMVEPPVAEDMASMPVGLQDDIEQILATIIRTSIDKEAAGELTNNEINEKIAVSVQPFNGRVTVFDTPSVQVPLWIYIAGGALLFIIIILVILFVRSRRAAEKAEVEEVIEEQEKVLHIEDINEEQETEGTLRRKQLEKMAKEKPEEFAKLLRTWIAED